METVTVKLERNGILQFTQLRQMPHDEKVVVGGKVKWGSGAKWVVLEASPSLVLCDCCGRMVEHSHRCGYNDSI